MSVTPESLGTDWSQLTRSVPSWFLDAKFGIFIHWGAYSVPAWAEPSGQLGELDDETFFARNPYAEWYANSMRIEGSPTQLHHHATYGDAPYDDFLDDWLAERFDADALVDVFARAGARYVVPTTKHHDGITLWPAPGTGTRNTVDRGPRRDLVGDMRDAAVKGGLRFGAYYSGGLDWHAAPTAPIGSQASMYATRPRSPAYAAYAYAQVADLVRRYHPDLLWNDIEWPDAAKVPGEYGLAELFGEYRALVPDGVVNDRWGVPMHDFRTSEYHAGLDNESAPAWEHCRGLGYSFGYNSREGAGEYLTVAALIRLLADIVSRGGNLLLNVGPKADGTLPGQQGEVLEGLAAWMVAGSHAIHGTRPLTEPAVYNSDDPWLRWTVGHDTVHAIADVVDGTVRIDLIPPEADPHSARHDGVRLAVAADSDRIVLRVAASNTPIIIDFDRRAA